MITVEIEENKRYDDEDEEEEEEEERLDRTYYDQM